MLLAIRVLATCYLLLALTAAVDGANKRRSDFETLTYFLELRITVSSS